MSKAKANSQTKTVIGQRGSILDVNGIPLAVDQKCYNVRFYRDPNRRKDEDRAQYTQVLLKVMEIVESNGGQTIDEFWLKRSDATGEWEFSTGTQLASAAAERERQWRANFALQYTAQEQAVRRAVQKLFHTRRSDRGTQDKGAGHVAGVAHEKLPVRAGDYRI